MKKITKRLIIIALCTPVLFIMLLIISIYIKFRYDFPANKNGHQDLLKATKVNVDNKRVFIQYTGWTDTQTYIRFKANSDEILEIVKSRDLKPNNYFGKKSVSFYWWKPKMNEKYKSFSETDGPEWTELYYNPSSCDAYFYSTTF